jgi:tetratricopeptide (TPR) repeat protein
MEAATGMKLAELEKKWRERIETHELGADWVTRAAADQPNRDKLMIEAAAKFPKYGEIQKSYAHALMRLGKNQEALASARAAIADPSFLSQDEAWGIVGSLLSVSDPKSAIEAFGTAVQPVLFRSYTDLLKKDGRAEEAEKFLAELERITAEDAIPGGN